MQGGIDLATSGFYVQACGGLDFIFKLTLGSAPTDF